MQNIFDRFKKQATENSLVPAKLPGDVRIVLDYDETGMFISIADKNLRKISLDSSGYNGLTREILKSVEEIRQRERFSVNWTQREHRLYLVRYPYLANLIARSDLLVNRDGQPIVGADGISGGMRGRTYRIVLQITGEKLLTIKVSLDTGVCYLTDIHMINDKYVLSEGAIYEIQPLGPAFSDISLLNSKIKASEFEAFLSLVFSNFLNIAVVYDNYEVLRGEPVAAQPCLIFAEVDENSFLHLSLSYTVYDFSPDFFTQYDVRSVARVNDLEEKIIVHEVMYDRSENHFKAVFQHLNRKKRELSLRRAFYKRGNTILITPKLADVFISHIVPRLSSQYRFYGVENLKRYRFKDVFPRLKLSLTSGIDFLEGSGTVEIDDENFSVFRAISLYRKHNYIPLSSGDKALVNSEFFRKLERLIKKANDKNHIRISFFDLPIIDELIQQKITDEGYNRTKEVFLGFNKLKNESVDLPRIRGTLREYQVYGFKWLHYLHSHSLGGCLADDMGLGKTVQTIALLSKLYQNGKVLPSLVVVPKTLLFNWENEIAKFAPHLSVYIYYDQNRDLEKARSKTTILTTYALVRNDIQKLSDEPFYCVILDEAQVIKNYDTRIAKAVMLLKTEHRLALSGTPIENNLSELYSLFRFLNPAMFGSLTQFNRDYLSPIQKEESREVIAELKRKIYPFVLRRLKKDVEKDLPPKIEQILRVEMDRDQKELYESSRRYYYSKIREKVDVDGIKRSQFLILQALLELRQIASIPEIKSDNLIMSPKRELLLDHIVDTISNRHKVLVFSNFISSLENIGGDLEKKEIEYLMMTGSTKDRRNLVERFQNDNKVKVFLMTLKTGGVGLNLTAAEYVFIFDPWWNRAAESQAVDRTHRIGQSKKIFCYKLITKDSIEEKILLLQEKKRNLSEQVITQDAEMTKTLNEGDLEYIMGSGHGSNGR